MKIFRTVIRASRDVRNHFASEHVLLLPWIAPLKRYTFDKLRHDSRSALNVTLLAVAQAIAFASIAGLPVVYGVLCTAVAAMVAPLFSASRHTIMGPTNATALMLFSFFSANPDLAGRWSELIPLLVLMVGIIATIGALVRVADLMQFVSRSVLVGYISGAAVLILTNQVAHLLGVTKWIDADSSTSFVGLVVNLVNTLPLTDWVSLAIGSSTLVIYYTLMKWKPTWPVFAITLIIASAIFGALIRFKVAPFSSAETFRTFGFDELIPRLPHLFRADVFNDISSLLGVAFAIAFLATLENTLMAKALASRSGDHADVNQDMFSVGMANIASAIAGGMPASGSLTRSTLNFDSGARTRFASFFSGVYSLCFAILIATSVNWGVPLIDYIPKAALAALVIALSFSLFNLRNIRICLHSTNDDAAVIIVTFVATLLAPLHVAIFIGVAISISLFLRKASRPYLVEYEFSDEGELREMGEKRKRPIPAISIVHVEGELFFGAAELFRTQIQRTVSDPAIQVIILRLKNARHLDATSVMALEDLIRFMREKKLHLIVSGASREVYRVLKKSGVLVTLQEGCDRRTGETNLFLTNPRNPNLSTRGALKRAQQLLGTEKADIRIFYDPSQQAQQP
ncbi:MAG: SulP family inorganic anion transporter [Gloeobacteraceae cyanobacterium ES-bin-144]|nr:SulP family inorganic anion transporter [Verrucomicrobiales bacterium]